MSGEAEPKVIAADQLLRSIEDLENKGQKVIPLASLKSYLIQFSTDDETLREQRSQYEQRAYEAELTRWKAQTERATTFAVENFKSVIEAGASALRAGMVINGGGAIALLTFLGNVMSRADNANAWAVSGMSTAMLAFFVGTAAACLGYMMRYLSQYGYAEDIKCLAITTHILAVIGGLASMFSFFLGGWIAYGVFSSCPC